MTRDFLLRQVRRARRRAFAVGAGGALSAAAAAGSLILAAAFLLAPLAGARGRWAVLAGFACASTAALAAGVQQWLALRPRRTEAEAARMLAGEEPELRDLIVTGADLARWGDEGARARGASGELVRAQVEAAARAAEGLEVREAAPLSPLLRRMALAAGAIAALAAVLLYDSPWGAFRVTELSAGGEGAKIEVGNLVLTVAPPVYTGLETTVEEGAGGDVRGYPGSRVTLSGKLSGEADSGQWEGPGGERIPLEIDGADFRVSWLLKEAGKYQLAFRRGLKPAPADFPPRTIALLADARPEVELLLPEGDLEVSASREVEVRFRAEDDFAVERARVVLQGAEEVRLPLSVKPGKSVQGGLSFLPLSHPRIGDGAYLRVEVWDNDDVMGPKSGMSRSVYLVVQSRKRMQAEMESYEERLFEAMIGYLADLLETPEIAGEAAEKLVRSGEDLLRLLDAVTEKAAQGQEQGFLGVLSFTRIAAPLRTAVERFFAERAAAAGGLTAELERDILFLDDSLRELRMDEVLSMGEDLQAIERDLYDRLRSGEDASSLLKAVDEIERLIEEMGRKLSRGSGELPDSFANSDAVKERPESELERMLKELREALRAGDRERASELAEEILGSLSEWMEALEKAADETMRSSDSPLRKEIEELLDRVSKGMAEQERMMGQTREAGDAASRRTLEAFQAVRDEFFRLQEERLLEVERRVREVDGMAPQPSSRESGPGEPAPPSEEAWDELLRLRNAALDGVRRTRQSLRDSLGEALDSARRLEEAVMRFGGLVGGLLAETPVERGKAEESARKGARAAADVAKDIEDLLASRKDRLEPDELLRLAELGGEEERLGGEIDDIAKRLAELAEKTPVIGSGLEKAAREGSREARGAGKKLGEGDPYAALPGERRVIEKLSEISQELGEVGQQLSERSGRGDRRRGGRGGRDIDRGRVEIPAETEAREWKAFREEVLRAMRERDYPKEYEKEVERYYERLIR